MKTGFNHILLPTERQLAKGVGILALALTVLLSLTGFTAPVFSLGGLRAPLLSSAGEGPAPLPEGEVPTASVSVTIIHMTDFHGALLSEDTDRATGKPVGGAAVVAALLETERERAGGEVILLDGGDCMQGSAISNLSKGEAVVEFMNALGFDACAIGNHEFDWGLEVLEERISDPILIRRSSTWIEDHR